MWIRRLVANLASFGIYVTCFLKLAILNSKSASVKPSNPLMSILGSKDHRDLSSLSGPHTSSSDFRAVFEFICLFRPALLQPLATAAGVEAQQCILARLCDLSCRALTG